MRSKPSSAKGKKTIDPDTPLLSAVWRGDVGGTKEILEQNPSSIHDRDRILNRPALMLAAQWHGVGVGASEKKKKKKKEACRLTR